MLSWNCQGLERPLIVHNLTEIYRSHSPKVVFYVTSIGLSNAFRVDLKGIAGVGNSLEGGDKSNNEGT